MNNRAEHNKCLPGESENVIMSPPSVCPSEQRKESIDFSEKHVEFKPQICQIHVKDPAVFPDATASLACNIKCQLLLFLEELELNVLIPYWLGSKRHALVPR